LKCIVARGSFVNLPVLFLMFDTAIVDALASRAAFSCLLVTDWALSIIDRFCG
jgi:hypothetical protein